MKSPDQCRRRQRKRDRPRSKTIAWRTRLTRKEQLQADFDHHFAQEPHPERRGECRGATRPCTFIACRHHLYCDPNGVGSLVINFPDLDVHELPETCALDAAERGAMTLEEVGDTMNLTRERVRQLEVKGLAKLREALEVSSS